MTIIKECIEGHYEVEEVPYGKVYKWAPGHALVECDCGQVIIVEPTTTVCRGCGADYAAVMPALEDRVLEEDEAYRPEHWAYKEWQRRNARPEHYEWLELEAVP